jgi:hypothetical protein
MTLPKAEKAREARLRRLAEAYGFALRRCPARNPDRPGFGTYAIVEPNHNMFMAGDPRTGYGLDLDYVESWLADYAEKARQR